MAESNEKKDWIDKLTDRIEELRDKHPLVHYLIGLPIRLLTTLMPLDRKNYWIHLLILTAVGYGLKLFVAGKDGRVDPDLYGVFIVGWLFILWVLMTTLVNRLHDINHRGLWALIIIVPVVIFPPAIVIAPVFCVILGCIPSSATPYTPPEPPKPIDNNNSGYFRFGGNDPQPAQNGSAEKKAGSKPSTDDDE